jgi:hypothetical protein
MPTLPAVALLAVAILLVLLALCYFFQGRRHKGPRESEGSRRVEQPRNPTVTARLLVRVMWHDSTTLFVSAKFIIFGSMGPPALGKTDR